jgi:Predicted transcription factor, homolog of eukaryotic MBF1
MNCELCGKPIKFFHEVMIEDSILRVCDDCAKYGKEIKKKNKSNVVGPQPAASPNRIQVQRPITHTVKLTPKKPKLEEQEDIDLVENFGEIIRKKREEMNLSQEDFAKKLQEKKNLIAKIEREEIKPDLQTARKIEKMLGVKLLEKF